MAKYVVTGATSFIGKAVVEKLLQKSDFDSVKKSVECNFSSYLINNKL